MAISKDEVKYIAQLAKLHFEEDVAEKFAKEEAPVEDDGPFY